MKRLEVFTDHLILKSQSAIFYSIWNSGRTQKLHFPNMALMWLFKSIAVII